MFLAAAFLIGFALIADGLLLKVAGGPPDAGGGRDRVLERTVDGGGGPVAGHP